MAITRTRKDSAFRLAGSTRKTWDIGSTAAGGQATTTVNIAGAHVGDSVVVTPDSPTSGWVYSGYVSAASTITLRAVNASGATADPASTIFTVLLLRS